MHQQMQLLLRLWLVISMTWQKTTTNAKTLLNWVTSLRDDAFCVFVHHDACCDCRLVVMGCSYWHWPTGSVQQCNTVEKSWTADDQWLDVKWWVLARWSLFYCLWFNCSILACLSPHMCSGMTLGHPVMDYPTLSYDQFVRILRGG